MKTCIARFNGFLLVVLAALPVGCKSPGESKDMASVQFHIEVNPDGTDKSGPVTIGRSVPFQVNVDRMPFLSERYLTDAAVVEETHGFALKLSFDQKGVWLLEQYSSAYRGKRVAIMARWAGEGCWLGAPRLEKRITDGVIQFTPDLTRAETEDLVKTLNKTAKEIQSGRF
jgi:preprotein translocase subunit SecD